LYFGLGFTFEARIPFGWIIYEAMRVLEAVDLRPKLMYDCIAIVYFCTMD